MVPPRAQVHRAALLQLAGKAEDRHRPALHAAPGVVGHHAQRHARVAHGAAYAAQRVGHIPGAHGARLGGQAAQAVEIVGARRAGECLQHLAEWRGEILRVARGDASRELGDQRAVAVVAVGRAAARGRAVQGIVGGGRRAVVGQVAGQVVAIPRIRDLVREVVRGRGGAAVDRDRGAVAGQVVAVRIAGAGAFGCGGKALEAVVGIGDHAGRVGNGRRGWRRRTRRRRGGQVLRVRNG